LNISQIVRKLAEFLDRKDSTREILVQNARDIIRHSKDALKHMYLGNMSESRAVLEKMRKLCAELKSLVKEYPDLLYGGLMVNALTEYIEAEIVYSILTRGIDIPAPEDLDVDPVPYVLGLADALSELRRFILEYLRRGDVESAEKLLNCMEEIFLEISTLQYPEGLLPGFRRKCDIIRRLIDETKSDIIFVKTRRK